MILHVSLFTFLLYWKTEVWQEFVVNVFCLKFIIENNYTLIYYRYYELVQWSRLVTRNLQFVSSSLQVEADMWRVRALSCFTYAFPYARVFGRYMIVWDCTDQPVHSFHMFLWDNRANAGLFIRPWPTSMCVIP
jgi:hypothetical protein